MTTIILIRHGQTAWNRVERFRGREDLPLDQTGQHQAVAAARAIAARWSPSAIYSSPLKRARQTAQAIGVTCNLSVESRPGFVDIDYGFWQGKTAAEAQERYPSEYEAWLRRPQTVEIPGGETLEQVRSRAMDALQELIAAHVDETIVVVGHTVVNRLLLCAVLGLPTASFWRLRQETAAINVFEWDGQDFTLSTINDTCHLQREPNA